MGIQGNQGVIARVATGLLLVVCPYLALACPVLAFLTVFLKCRPSVPLGRLTTATAFEIVPTPSNATRGKLDYCPLLGCGQCHISPDFGYQFYRRHPRELRGSTSKNLPPNTPSRTARVVPPFECQSDFFFCGFSSLPPPETLSVINLAGGAATPFSPASDSIATLLAFGLVELRAGNSVFRKAAHVGDIFGFDEHLDVDSNGIISITTGQSPLNAAYYFLGLRPQHHLISSRIHLSITNRVNGDVQHKMVYPWT